MACEGKDGEGGLSIEHAMVYLQEVEKELPKNEFAEFLETIEDFKSNRLSTTHVVQRVKRVLEGKPPALIRGFNMFLPAEHHIKPAKFSIALDLVKKIRDRYETKDPEVLTAFVDLLRRFQRDLISLEETRSHVRELFANHTDVLADFEEFLPCGADDVADTPPPNRQDWYETGGALTQHGTESRPQGGYGGGGGSSTSASSSGKSKHGGASAFPKDGSGCKRKAEMSGSSTYWAQQVMQHKKAKGAEAMAANGNGTPNKGLLKRAVVRLSLAKSAPPAGKIQSRKGTPVRFLGAAQTGNMAADGSKAEGGAMRGGGGEEGHVAGLGRAQCGDMAANDGGEGPGVGTREGGMSGGADRRSLIPNEDLLAVLPLPILKHVQAILRAMQGNATSSTSTLNSNVTVPSFVRG